MTAGTPPLTVTAKPGPYYPGRNPPLWNAFRASLSDGTFGQRTLLHLLLASLVCCLLIYISTGTLAPYSAVSKPFELLRCGYTTNGDHINYLQVHWMLWGWPKHSWETSVVLRRILYHVVASPGVILFGFAIGGIITNFIITLAGLLVWCWTIFTQFGRRAAILTTWILATSPGIAYWAGLPYSYAAIIPASAVAVWAIFLVFNSQENSDALLCGLVIGGVSQAYEIAPLFAPAALLLIVLRARFKPLIPFMAGLVLPFAATYLLLYFVFQADASSSNTSIYGTLIGAYLGIFTGDIDYAAWLKNIAEAPYILVSNLLYATFWVPVILLAGVKLYAWRLGLRLRFHAVSTALFLAMAAVWAFNNLAPDYPGWQLRGTWIARLYQPVLIPVLVEIAAVILAIVKSGSPNQPLRPVIIATALAAAMQGIIVASGILNFPQVGQFFYEGFYTHAPHGTYVRHLETYGRRPFGFCVSGPAQTWPRMNRARD